MADGRGRSRGTQGGLRAQNAGCNDLRGQALKQILTEEATYVVPRATAARAKRDDTSEK